MNIIQVELLAYEQMNVNSDPLIDYSTKIVYIIIIYRVHCALVKKI